MNFLLIGRPAEYLLSKRRTNSCHLLCATSLAKSVRHFSIYLNARDALFFLTRHGRCEGDASSKSEGAKKEYFVRSKVNCLAKMCLYWSHGDESLLRSSNGVFVLDRILFQMIFEYLPLYVDGIIIDTVYL